MPIKAVQPIDVSKSQVSASFAQDFQLVSKTNSFVKSVKKFLFKNEDLFSSNLKTTIVLWLLGGVLTTIGMLLFVLLIGIPILILGLLSSFVGTLFFYKWIIQDVQKKDE